MSELFPLNIVFFHYGSSLNKICEVDPHFKSGSIMKKWNKLTVFEKFAMKKWDKSTVFEKFATRDRLSQTWRRFLASYKLAGL